MKWFAKYIVLKFKYKCLLDKYESETKLFEEEKGELWGKILDKDFENKTLLKILKGYEENEK